MHECKGWSSSFDWIFFFSKDNKELFWMDKNLNGWQSKLVFLRVQFLVHCLLDNLESNVKLFADDTSMFSVVRDPIKTLQKLNNDLDKVSPWANKWKMYFNPDPPKQAQEVIFWRKINNVYHLPLLFDNSTAQIISS